MHREDSDEPGLTLVFTGGHASVLVVALILISRVLTNYILQIAKTIPRVTFALISPNIYTFSLLQLWFIGTHIQGKVAVGSVWYTSCRATDERGY